MFNFIWLTTVEDERELINAAAIRKISPAKVFIDTAEKVDVSQVFWLNGESTFYKESPIDVHRKLRGRD